jgi:uncharacterized protein involved in exopolysaccharide biosynthesis
MNEIQGINSWQAAEDEEISLLDLLQTIADHLRLLVLGPLAAGMIALIGSFLITPTYTAITQFLPPQQQQGAAAAMLQSLGSLGGLAGAAAGIKNPSDQYIAFMKSRSLQDAIIDRFDLMKKWELELRQDARMRLEGSVRITSGKDGIIDVEVDDEDPVFAAAMANAHVEELRILMNRLAVTEAQQRRQYFEQQLQKAKDNMVKAEQALKATGVNSTAIKSSPEAAVGAVAEIQARIAAQEIKIGSMRGYLTESAPDFKQALTELSALRAQLSKLEAGGQGSSSGSDYIARFREYKYHETLFELFAKQYELARADEAREGAVIQVLDIATPPDRKSKPKKALIAVITTLAVGFALLLFVFVRQALRNAAKDPESSNKLQQIKSSFQRAWSRHA